MQLGAELWLSRARFEDVRFTGIASLVGATATLDGVDIVRVGMSDCAMTSCPELSGAFGLGASYGETLTASAFSVEDIAVCGVAVGQNDPDGPLRSLDD